MRKGLLYGLVAEFLEPQALLRAAQAARFARYRRMDAFTPYFVEGVAEQLGVGMTGVPLCTWLCGVVGGVTGYGMQYYSAVRDYPLNVGGRPLHSWPAFIPITFELAVLGAALGAALAMLIFNGLPRLHHPIFETPFFRERNGSHFYLCIEARDRHFDLEKTRAFLAAQSPQHIWEVHTP
jgi:hypothetical protein